MKKLIAVALLAVGCAMGQVYIRIGPPPPPRVVHVRPTAPGPGYFWVDGYWYPVSGHYRWHDGYWTRPPYEGARWVGPRHEEGRFYAGYWDGDHGRRDHDHHWDHDRYRDYRDHDRH
jgi:hypothetical protein